MGNHLRAVERHVPYGITQCRYSICLPRRHGKLSCFMLHLTTSKLFGKYVQTRIRTTLVPYTAAESQEFAHVR